MSEKTNASCACDTAPKLIFACSGAADVGEIADRAARQLTREGAGKMYCLAGVGGRVETILANVHAASALLAIDGCPLDCAKNTLAQAGFANAAHLRLTDAGFKKGSVPATEENVLRAVALAKPLLGG